MAEVSADEIRNKMWTETEIHEFIKNSVPEIGYSDLWDIRNRFIYDSIPLDIAIKIKEYIESRQKRRKC